MVLPRQLATITVSRSPWKAKYYIVLNSISWSKAAADAFYPALTRRNFWLPCGALLQPNHPAACSVYYSSLTIWLPCGVCCSSREWEGCLSPLRRGLSLDPLNWQCIQKMQTIILQANARYWDGTQLDTKMRKEMWILLRQVQSQKCVNIIIDIYMQKVLVIAVIDNGNGYKGMLATTVRRTRKQLSRDVNGMRLRRSWISNEVNPKTFPLQAQACKTKAREVRRLVNTNPVDQSPAQREFYLDEFLNTRAFTHCRWPH